MTRNLPLTLPANSYLLGVWSSREDNVTCLPPTWSYIAEFFIYSARVSNNQHIHVDFKMGQPCFREHNLLEPKFFEVFFISTLFSTIFFSF